jgi:hypothetical protein
MSPVFLCLPILAQAGDIPADPGNYRARLGRLQPGDTLVLAPGTYDRGLPLTGTRGEPGRLIEIRGPADRSAVFTARPCCNTVQLEDVAYVVVRNLTLDGRASPGSHGVASRGPCHDVTVENLRIVNHGGSQQTVGISTKGPAWNWIIRGNAIVGAGTGMYLGDSDGSDPFVNGLIEHNVVLDTLGYNLQIKHQAPRPADVGLPTAPSRTIIRRNVFSKANNANGGPNARPNLLVGHFPLTGPGADDRYEIHGNFFYENPTHTLFQGEGNVTIHDNVFVNRSGGAINVRPHNDRPREILIHHNTVLAAERGIRVAGGDPLHRQRVIGNAVFAARPIEAPDQSDNITGPAAEAGANLIAPNEPLGRLDLRPKPGRLRGPPIDPATLSLPMGLAVDFDGRPRSWTVRGAYETSGGPELGDIPLFRD